MISEFLRLIARLGGLSTDFVVTRQPDYPSNRKEKSRELVVVGEGDIQKWACMTCPGGCGARIALSLNPNRKPRWKVSMDFLRRPTVHPSVHQTNACGCHFWIKKGRVEWCRNGRPKPL